MPDIAGVDQPHLRPGLHTTRRWVEASHVQSIDGHVGIEAIADYEDAPRNADLDPA